MCTLPSICETGLGGSASSCCAIGGAISGDGTYIIMEHLNFTSGGDQAALGEQVARMHLAAPAVRT